MIDSVPLTTAQQALMRQQNNRLKLESKVGIQISLCFKLSFRSIYIFLTYCQSSEHLHDILVNKLLAQFTELHNTQFFKKPNNLT